MMQARLVLGAVVVALGLVAPAYGKRAPGPPVPPGWTIETSVQGDLTGDGIADTAMVIRQLDPAKVIKNDGLGASELDTNPRRLLVFERTGRGFSQIAASSKLVPPAGNPDIPCLTDPLEEGGLAITGQVLTVSLQYWLSCGSWGVTSTSYKFKRSAGRFRLIGYDRTEYMRNSGQGEQVSVNFLTNRKSSAPYDIEGNVPERLRWTRIKPQRYFLDTLDLGSCPAVDAKTYLC